MKTGILFAVVFLAASLVIGENPMAEVKPKFDENVKNPSNDVSRRVVADSRMRGGNTRERIYMNRFYECLERLPKSVGSSERFSVSCDNTGKIWAVNASNKTCLYDGRVGKVVYEATQTPFLEVSPNGKYLVAFGDEDETAKILEIGSLKTLAPGLRSVQFFAEGRYVHARKGEEAGIFDLENPGTIRKPELERWFPPNFSLSGDRRWMFGRSSTREPNMILWELPAFREAKVLGNMASGVPFISDKGGLVGSYVNNVFYVHNLSTGQTRGYGLSRNQQGVLLEVVRGKRAVYSGGSDGEKIYRDTDVVTQTLDLATLQSIDEFEVEDENGVTGNFVKHHLGPGYASVVQALPETGSNRVWLAINRFDSWQAEDGDSVFLLLGEDLAVKKVVRCTQRIPNLNFYDSENRTLRMLDDEGRATSIRLDQLAGSKP